MLSAGRAVADEELAALLPLLDPQSRPAGRRDGLCAMTVVTSDQLQNRAARRPPSLVAGD